MQLPFPGYFQNTGDDVGSKSVNFYSLIGFLKFDGNIEMNIVSSIV